MSFYRGLIKTAVILHGALPLLLSITLLFGFDSPETALMTLSAALFHEAGHIGAMLALGIPHGGVKARMGGLMIVPKKSLSYKEEIISAAAGPAASLLGAAIAFAASFSLGDFFVIYALINLITAFSNLIPVRGYDGYRIIYCAAALKTEERTAFRICYSISFFFSAVLCFTALFFMLRCGAGFFLFFSFFAELLCCMASGRIFGGFKRKQENARDFKRKGRFFHN